MVWEDENCARCIRSFKGTLPPFNETQKLVNLKRECRLRFAIHIAAGFGTGMIPHDIADIIGKNQNGFGLKDTCMMFSDDENDGPPRPKRTPPEDPMQFMLFSVTDELMEEESVVEPEVVEV